MLASHQTERESRTTGCVLERVKSGVYQVVANDVIALLEGTNYFNFLGFSSRIYVRHCYLQLWKACLDTFNRAANAKHDAVIIGNEGIGNTYFAYILLCLPCRGATVVYETPEARRCYLFSNDLVIDGYGRILMTFLTGLKCLTFRMKSDQQSVLGKDNFHRIAFRVCLV